jgi:pre-mRNA-splicing factor SYF2
MPMNERALATIGWWTKEKNWEKEKKKRKWNDFDATGVGYINQRNKRFNEKISRSYDEETAKIRQNLERGTAL